MLRQGRGDGFRAALRTGRDAGVDVLACVVEDPRWDRQVEQRDHYYASLVTRLDIDIAPITERVLREDDSADQSDFWLPIGVLAELARRAHDPAKQALAEAIRRGCQWRACLDALDAAGGEALIRDVVRSHDLRALVQLVDVDALIDAVRAVAAPWSTWAVDIPALRFVLDAPTRSEASLKPTHGPVAWAAGRIRPTPGPVVNPSMTTGELLELATASGASREVEKILRARSDESTMRLLRSAAVAGTPEQQFVALRILAERGCEDFVSDAELFLRDESRQSHGDRKEHRTSQAYLRYLDQLPASITLERARTWFAEPWPLSLAAERILAQHATADDRVVLENAGSTAIASSDMYRLCSVVDALTSIGAEESVPFLHEVYQSAPYSYARRRVVRALLPHRARDTARKMLNEALWDCETESRALACAAVSVKELSSARRLAELAHDAFEDESVRTAAQQSRETP